MRKQFLLTVASVGGMVLLTGCGSGGGTNGGAVAFGPLAGTWRATDLTGGGPDIPCPATVAGAGGNTTTGSTPAQFGCGASDTFTFRSDNTFTVTTTSTTSTSAPVSPTVTTYTGRWAQFQTRVMLTVSGDNSASYPYSTNFDFRNENQILIVPVGFTSINRYVFTRQ